MILVNFCTRESILFPQPHFELLLNEVCHFWFFSLRGKVYYFNFSFIIYLWRLNPSAVSYFHYCHRFLDLLLRNLFTYGSVGKCCLWGSILQCCFIVCNIFRYITKIFYCFLTSSLQSHFLSLYFPIMFLVMNLINSEFTLSVVVTNTIFYAQ